MAFSFVASSTQNGSGTSFSVAVPSGVAAGDILICVATWYGTATTLTLPATFTGLRLGQGAQSTQHWYQTAYRVATGSESSYTFTTSATTWPVITIFAIRGGNASFPISGHYVKADAASYLTTCPAPSYTINNSADATVYCYAGMNSGASGSVTLTMPGTLSDTTQNGNTSSGAVLGFGWGTNVTSPGSATASAGIDYLDFAFDLNPLAVNTVVALTGTGNVTSTVQASGSSIVVNKPANVADMDLLVAFVYMQTDGTFSATPSGWTAFSPDPHTTGGAGGEKRNTRAFYKHIPVAASESATTYTWTGAGGRGAAVIFRVLNASATPENAFSAVAASGTSDVLPSVTPTVANTLILGFGYNNNSSGNSSVWTPPGTMNEVATVTTGASGATSALEIAQHWPAAASASGTRTFTLTPNPVNCSGFMVAIAPLTPVESISEERFAVYGPVESTTQELWAVADALFTPVRPVVRTGVGNLNVSTVTSASTLTLTKPSNTVNADLLVAVLYTRNSGLTWTAIPDGWLPFTPHQEASGAFRAYYKYIPIASLETDLNYTFVSGNGSARAIGVIFRVQYAAAAGAENAASVMSALSGVSSIIIPALSTTTANTTLLAFNTTNNSAGSVIPTYTPPGGMTEITTASVITSSGATSTIEIAQQDLSASGSTGSRTFTLSPAASQSCGFMIALSMTGTRPAGVLNSTVVGAPTSQGVGVTIESKGALTHRLAMSTVVGMTSPFYSASVAPDIHGATTFFATGLNPSTEYFYQAEVDSVLTGPVGRFRTLPPVGQAYSFSYAAVSCGRTNSNTTSYQKIREKIGAAGQKALFVAHLGDMHYDARAAANDDRLYRSCYRNVMQMSQAAQTFREIPLMYTISDHDTNVSNTDGLSVGIPAVQRTIRSFFPNYTFPASDGKGLYRSWVVGRVRFIMTDGRSYMDPITDVDDAFKTKLGAEQKAWIKSESLAARSAGQIVVLFHEDAFSNGPHVAGDSNPQTYIGDDTWEAYSVERNELVNFWKTNGISPFIIHGDLHMLGADSGVNTPGNFPVACISPLDQTFYLGNGIYSQGTYPTAATGGTGNWEQFGWFDVTDNGTTITIAYSGIDSGGTTRISMSVVYVVAQRQGRLKKWDSGTSTWVPYVVKDNHTEKIEKFFRLWNGSHWRLI